MLHLASDLETTLQRALSIAGRRGERHATTSPLLGALRGAFGLADHDAKQKMMQVHKAGSAACGVFPKTTALAKMAAVEKLAHDGQHPLRSVMQSQEV